MNVGGLHSNSRTERIQLRRGMLGCGAGFTVALDDKGGIRYTGENRWGQAAATAWQNMLAVYCGGDYVLGLCRDGTVIMEGRSHFHPSEIESWACVSAISCGQRHAAALIENGRVLCAGANDRGQCDTHLWRDMVDVCCGHDFTVGLRQDGTVLLAGGSRAMAETVESWRDLAGIFTDYEGKYIYGITGTEGRLVSTAILPLRARRWIHLVSAAASARGVWGVTSHGRMLSTNAADARFFHRRVGEFVACAAGHGHIAVLCKGGEVLSTGRSEFGQTATTRWGNLYTGFESFGSARREAFLKKTRTEREYQRARSEATRYARRLSCGERLTACIQADGHVSATAGLRRVKKWTDVCALSCGSAHILALHKDGRVSADGNNVGGCCRVEEWRSGKQVIAGKYHSLCLTEDGRVLFAGWNLHGQGDVTEWKHIRILRGTDTYTVGVDAEGHILTAGKRLPFDPAGLSAENWRDLVDVAVSGHHIVGLRADGRVVSLGDATCYTCPAKDRNGVLDVSDWRGIRAIAAGDGFTVGLCYGGRVVAAGKNHLGQCETSGWQHAVYIGCGRTYTAALLADGRVVTAGQHRSGLGGKDIPGVAGGAVMSWEKAESTGYEPFRTAYMTDMIAIHAGAEHLVAVDAHGQVMAEGLDLDGQCTSASTFLLFRDIRQLDGFGIFSSAMPTHAPLRTAGKPSDAEICPEAADSSFPVMTEKATAGEASAASYLTRAGQELDRAVYIDGGGNVRAIARDGTVTDVEGWTDALAVACGTNHTVVALRDGSLAATGRNAEGQCEVSGMFSESPWRHLSCHHHTTVAVDGEGRVHVRGRGYGDLRSILSDKEIRAAACGYAHMILMTADGHALGVGDNRAGQCDVSDWEDIVMVAVGDRHSVGLRADGRLVAVGDNTSGQCRVDDLTDVTFVACLPETTLCVRSDGKVILRGGAKELESLLGGLPPVVCLYAHEYRVSALTSDGRLICVV